MTIDEETLEGVDRVAGQKRAGGVDLKRHSRRLARQAAALVALQLDR